MKSPRWPRSSEHSAGTIRLWFLLSLFCCCCGLSAQRGDQTLPGPSSSSLSETHHRDSAPSLLLYRLISHGFHLPFLPAHAPTEISPDDYLLPNCPLSLSWYVLQKPTPSPTFSLPAFPAQVTLRPTFFPGLDPLGRWRTLFIFLSLLLPC